MGSSQFKQQWQFFKRCASGYCMSVVHTFLHSCYTSANSTLAKLGAPRLKIDQARHLKAHERSSPTPLKSSAIAFNIYQLNIVQLPRVYTHDQSSTACIVEHECINYSITFNKVYTACFLSACKPRAIHTLRGTVFVTSLATRR